ncbi:hypothetical protein ACFX13_036382 [Malus domestica]
MEKGSQRQTESERADLDAIAALKESSAIEFKEKGNECEKREKAFFGSHRLLHEGNQSASFDRFRHLNSLFESSPCFVPSCESVFFVELVV